MRYTNHGSTGAVRQVARYAAVRVAMEKYEFLSKLGEGAYGSVWKCLNTLTGEFVAVKKLKDAPQTEKVRGGGRGARVRGCTAE